MNGGDLTTVPDSLVSLSPKFPKIADEKEEISGFRGHFNRIASHKVDWETLKKCSKIWIKNPLNMALLLWITCVAISGAILFLVMTGMLNNVLTKKSERDAWFEVSNQIINALFTLMSLYQHPRRFHHLVLLCRWKPKDVSMLRKIYSKNGTYKPHERAHMLVVIVLLHVNCFAQYALCGLNLGYKKFERPNIGVVICLVIAMAAQAIAGVYCIVSPLGKEYNFEFDEEAQDQKLTNGVPQLKSSSLIPLENEPQWKGGLLDLTNDGVSMTNLYLLCGFCMFGYNMERLGFGNMYVHIATFFLFCTAPLLIFGLAATHFDNVTIREALGVTGIVLGVFGLLYGGFWRIQMRKKFNLPSNRLCCGNPAVTDCAQWLFCCWCSLAQEFRTANHYEMVDNKFRQRAAVSPLQDGDEKAIQLSISSPSILVGKEGCLQSPKVKNIVIISNPMKPPVVPSTIPREDITIL